MKLLDLFSGIGGFSLAFLETFPEGKVIGYSEIDKYAIQIYEKNFKGHKNYGDIRQHESWEFPESPDIITFGFPCQDLSIAGKRAGFNGFRSSLFFNAVDLINGLRPRYFLFENVKGLFSSNKGEDFIKVLQTIAEIGYDGEWQLVNSKYFGVPQNRERIYFVGYSAAERVRQILPIGEDETVFNKQNRFNNTKSEAEPVATTINRAEGRRSETNFIIEPQHKHGGNLRRYYETAPTVQARYGTGGDNIPYVLNSQPRCGDTKKGGTGLLLSNDHSFAIDSNPHKIIQLNQNKNEKGWVRNQNRIYDINGISPASNTRNKETNKIKHNDSIRRLTEIECERLQSFPDNWTEGVSSTQRYKCLGNAITVNVAREIFKSMKEKLENE